MGFKRLDDSLATLEMAVDLLEDSAARALAPRPRRQSGKAPQADDVGLLFSPDQLTSVKQRLDDAIERLESALETADGAR